MNGALAKRASRVNQAGPAPVGPAPPSMACPPCHPPPGETRFLLTHCALLHVIRHKHAAKTIPPMEQNSSVAHSTNLAPQKGKIRHR